MPVDKSRRWRPECAVDGCVTRPCYANLEDNKASHCAVHRLDTMVRFGKKECYVDGCTITPTYGLPGATSKTHCASHRLDTMVRIGAPECAVEGCKVSPCYCLAVDKSATHCASHRLDTMVRFHKKNCAVEGCSITPCFGLVGSTSKTHCASHRLDTMVHIGKKECSIEGCVITATYGLPGSKSKTHCAKHALDGMVSIGRVVCDIEGCAIRCMFGYAGKAPVRCARHKDDDMVDVASTASALCRHPGCKSRPSYFITGDAGKLLYCANHRPVCALPRCRLCDAEGCSSSASYGHDGIKERCVLHKLSSMTLVGMPMCIVNGCRKRRTFGYEGYRETTHCMEHREEGMVRTVAKCAQKGCLTAYSSKDSSGKGWCAAHKPADAKPTRCKKPVCNHPGCNRLPLFNIGDDRFCREHTTSDGAVPRFKVCGYNGCPIHPTFGVDRKATRCKLHAEPGMRRVSTAGLCEECPVRACFGFTKPTRCRMHKVEGMTFLMKKVVCEEQGCNTTACHGVEDPVRCVKHSLPGMRNLTRKNCTTCGKTAKYGFPRVERVACGEHKTVGMIADPNRRCSTTGCSAPAQYGPVGGSHTVCELHASSSDTQDFVEKRCSVCDVTNVLNQDGKCDICDPSTVRKGFLSKQRNLFEYLNKAGLPGDGDDRAYDAACGKERPDRVYHFETVAVVLECDEHQHRHINPDCERVRMLNIAETIGYHSTVFVRWNPDKYRTTKNMWSIAKRHQLCASLIRDLRDGVVTVPEGYSVTSVYLFFDDWSDGAPLQWNCLLAKETQ